VRFYFISLGCAKNLIDSEKLTEGLHKKGFVITDDIANASLIIINTCGFITEAKRESIDTIFSVLQEKPDNAKVLVYGCLVQRFQKELIELLPEIDLFLPILPKENLINKIVKHFPPSGLSEIEPHKKILFTPPSYTYVKISEGCKNHCSYCTIPSIRGQLRSSPAEDIISQIKSVLDRGIYEINLIAQDLTDYGIDLYKKPSLNILLKKILSIKRDYWLRLLYLYPSKISPELIEIIRSDSRIVKYLDIPIQHVNNRILKLMNRKYTKEILIKKIESLRKKIPSISLRTSLIVGFPSESEDDFLELLDFVQQIQFDHLGVFEYSPEEDTKAFSLKPAVPFNIKKKRKRIIMETQKKQVKAKNKLFKGKIFPCLIELPVDTYKSVWTGRIYSQAPEVDGIVYVTGYNETMGNIVNIRIKSFKDYDLIGECIV
jgi:ribosomal protein S12 methylthiotransferase